MRATIGIAVFAVVALSRSCAVSQNVASTDWVDDLTKNINAFTRNLQHQVGNLNERIQHEVNSEVARAHRLSEDAKKQLGNDAVSISNGGTVQVVGGGSNVVLSDNRGSKFVKSGHTSDGKAYVYESSHTIVDDILQDMITIRYPDLKISKVFGYTLNLKDAEAKPVPIQSSIL